MWLLRLIIINPLAPCNFHTVNWIFTPDPFDTSAFLISNYVTDKANESGAPPGTFKTYCENGTQLASGGYNIHILV